MLIIFDCDGTLVDSEGLAAQTFSETLHKYQIPWSASDCENRFRGKTLSDCFKILDEAYPNVLPNDFRAELDLATEQAFSQRLTLMPGVEELLEDLCKRQIPLCVASNGGYEKTCRSLNQTKIAHFFDGNVFSAEFVDKGKPAPDLFRYAAESMGVPAQYAVVIEDSPLGVQAAQSAGMYVMYFHPNQGSDSADITALESVIDSEKVNTLENIPVISHLNQVIDTLDVIGLKL